MTFSILTLSIMTLSSTTIYIQYNYVLFHDFFIVMLNITALLK